MSMGLSDGKPLLCRQHFLAILSLSIVTPRRESRMASSPAPILSPDIVGLIEAHKGIFLDIGCSDHKSAGSIGMDKRALPGVDIIHDLEVFPWPLPDNCASRMLCSHLIEHIKPWLTIDFLNECWRIMRPDGQLLIATPYAGSPRFWQDPTHCHGWLEATPQYFDCDYPLWDVYRPRCWKLELNNWQPYGDLNVILAKRGGDHPQHGQCEVQLAAPAVPPPIVSGNGHVTASTMPTHRTRRR
jgi:hypothetical protein